MVLCIAVFDEGMHYYHYVLGAHAQVTYTDVCGIPCLESGLDLREGCNNYCRNKFEEALKKEDLIMKLMSMSMKDEQKGLQ